MKRFIENAWGNAFAFLNRSRPSLLADVLLLGGVAGVIFGFFSFSHEWTRPKLAPVDIDLSPWALPKYTFYSLMRGMIAYSFSLLFTLVYGYWAAKDKIAQRVLIPLLDILQSIPVLGFLPILLIGLSNIFPNTKIGLELAAILMIFTGQAWNMTFSFYHSLSSIPNEQQECAAVYRFNWWQRFKWVELPSSMMGLVWNSMMSMAGGWFFLMISEAFQLGDTDFRLPGIGAYMSVASARNDTPARIYAILAMSLMIVLLDQFFWRPVVVWAQKFRVEEGGQADNASSWFLDFLRHSKILVVLKRLFSIFKTKVPRTASDAVLIDKELPDINKPSVVGTLLSRIYFVVLIGGMVWGGWQLLLLLKNVLLNDWLRIFIAAAATLGRVLVSTAIGTLWALPAGLAIGLSPKLSRFFQPIVQVVSSFPAPMLFPIVLFALNSIGIKLNFASIVLMLLGTQWYILFNVIAGSMAIPSDLKEMSRSFHVTGWERFKVLYVPAIFPYLVTGWVTAAGGAWNASIVAEYFKTDSDLQITTGLGAEISVASANNNFPVLAASVVVMSVVVVLFNRFVWRRLYNLAQTRFSLSK